MAFKIDHGYVPTAFRNRAVNLGKDTITNRVRVSTAALLRIDPHVGDYWLVETWIFSGDPRQLSRQIIHGTCNSCSEPSDRLIERAMRVHEHIVRNLRGRFVKPPTDSLACLP
jgi:hypothetical protein